LWSDWKLSVSDFGCGMHFGFGFSIIQSFGFGLNFGSKLNQKPKSELNIITNSVQNIYIYIYIYLYIFFDFKKIQFFLTFSYFWDQPSFCNNLVSAGNGQNYEYQNVENQKELRKPCKPSQRRKDL
jgi:hypothetical protein